jgi:hypothetical protein
MVRHIWVGGDRCLKWALQKQRAAGGRLLLKVQPSTLRSAPCRPAARAPRTAMQRLRPPRSLINSRRSWAPLRQRLHPTTGLKGALCVTANWDTQVRDELIATETPSRRYVRLSLNLRHGAQRVPPVQTGANGMADLSTWSVTYNGLSGPATMAHFHGPAVEGKNGPPTIWLAEKGATVASPIKGQATLTPEQAQQLTAGEWYVNVHTQANPNGEIRGQVMPPKN